MSSDGVSIVLPMRNAAATLAQTLASIGAQTHAHWELLAVDDGSEDASAETVAAVHDPRIRLLRPGRVGLVAALNRGLAEARYPLVARMDADDVMHPERLALQIDWMRANPRAALVATRVRVVPEEAVQAGYREYIRWQNGVLTAEDVRDEIYVESPFAHPSVLFRGEAVRAVGGYADGPFPEDYDLWLRLHAAGYAMGKVDRVLLDWAERADRTSRTDERYSRAAFDALRAAYLARDPRLATGRPIVIWGAGMLSRRRVRRLLARGVAIERWIDIDPRKIGRVYEGAGVEAPAWLARDGAEGRPFVLVYVTNHGARELIAASLHGFGYRRGDDYLMVG